MSKTTQIREGQYGDVMPDMSEEEFEALKRSIEEDGLRHPIEITPDGTILDGHHRFKACRELGIDPETVVVEDATIEQAIRANLTRRNLSDGSKREVVERYLEENYDGERTQKAIAEELGVSEATVSRSMERISPKEFTREEKRQQASEYLDEHPDASPRQVAASIDADVSHPTVRKWMDEWTEPDDGEEQDATDAGDDDLDEDYAGPGPDKAQEVNPEADELFETDSSEEADPSSGAGPSTPGDDPEDAEDTEPKELDTSDADDAQELGVKEPRSRAEPKRINELETENEELRERIERLREGSKRQAQKIDEYRDKALNVKMGAPDAEAVEKAKAHVDVAIGAIPATPVEEQGLTQEDINDAVDKATLQLEDAQTKLEEQL